MSRSTRAAITTSWILSGLLATITASAQQQQQQQSYRLEQNLRYNGHDLAEADRRRAVALGRNSKLSGPGSSQVAMEDAVSFAASTSPATIPIDNGFGSYYVKINVGEQEEKYQMFIDNGSSNTWVNGTKFVPTGDATNTGNEVQFLYGTGFFRGFQWNVDISLESTSGPLTAKRQGVGIANTGSGFTDVDGILALGPSSQTSRTQRDPNGVVLDELIPTVTETLFTTGAIPANQYSLALQPITDDNGGANVVGAGALTFGGVDPDYFIDSINYFPRETRTLENGSNLENYWSFSIDSLTMETVDDSGMSTAAASLNFETTQLLNETRYGIFDVGSTLVGLPKSVFDTYLSLLPGNRVNPNSGLVLIPFDQVPRMGNLTFSIGGNDYVMTPSAQLFPPEISTLLLGFTPESVQAYLSIFANTGFDKEDSFTLGMYWLERFYSTYNIETNQIGLANTQYTFQKTTELTSFRKAKRAHRDSSKRHEWMDGKARLDSLGARSPFSG